MLTHDDINNFLSSLDEIADSHSLQAENDMLRAHILDLEVIIQRIGTIACLPASTLPNSDSSSSIFRTVKVIGTSSLPAEQ